MVAPAETGEVGIDYGDCMAERTHKSVPKSDDAAKTTPAVVESSTEKGDRLRADLDDLLDEIDEVLESNAEDFVKSYVQKGGE